MRYNALKNLVRRVWSPGLWEAMIAVYAFITILALIFGDDITAIVFAFAMWFAIVAVLVSHREE